MRTDRAWKLASLQTGRAVGLEVFVSNRSINLRQVAYALFVSRTRED